jgi:hypothetical protein
LPTTSFPATSPKIRRSFARAVAASLLLAAACLHAQDAPFVFATRAQARAVLGAHDDYVRATAPLERSVLLRTDEPVDAARLAAAMAAAALDWNDEERRALAAVLPRLERFLAPMRWKAPRQILLVKASDALMDGFPHTRGAAIILPESMLREAMKEPALMDYVLSHEAFHVLSRADPELREELYRAIGFRACGAMELPAALAELRLTNPDAPESRHPITLRRGSERIEALAFVHFPSENVDRRKGFMSQIRTSWLPVDRQDGRCTARDERLTLDGLEGLDEQVGRNTAYLIHPEEIIADNFSFLFRTPEKVQSPEILERIRKVLH